MKLFSFVKHFEREINYIRHSGIRCYHFTLPVQSFKIFPRIILIIFELTISNVKRLKGEGP